MDTIKWLLQSTCNDNLSAGKRQGVTGSGIGVNVAGKEGDKTGAGLG